eukprot:scaffold258280_cov74-Attheya_sp.AAC.1
MYLDTFNNLYLYFEETSRRWNVATMLPERIQKYGGKQLSIHHDLSNIKRTEFRPTGTYRDNVSLLYNR